MGLRPTKPVVTRAAAQERLEEEYGLTAEHVEAFFWVLARKHVTLRNPSQPTTPESADSQVSSSENAPVDLVRPELDGDKGSPPIPKRRSRHSRAMANSSLLVLDGSNAATAHARSLSAGSALVRGGAANASTGNMGRASQGAQTGDSGNPSLAAAAAANMGGLAGTRNHGMSPRQSWRLRLDRVSPEVLRDELTATEPFFQLGRVASDRLFEVLGSDGEGLTLDQFYCALYLFTCAREEETYRLLFNMFDLNGSNFIRKERFRVMVLEVAKGHLSDLPENFDEEFAALSKVIGDVGMTLYDQNKDGKLSFDEWCQYAREDDAIRICLDPAPRAAALGPLLARIMACRHLLLAPTSTAATVAALASQTARATSGEIGLTAIPPLAAMPLASSSSSPSSGAPLHLPPPPPPSSPPPPPPPPPTSPASPLLSTSAKETSSNTDNARFSPKSRGLRRKIIR